MSSRRESRHWCRDDDIIVPSVLVPTRFCFRRRIDDFACGRVGVARRVLAIWATRRLYSARFTTPIVIMSDRIILSLKRTEGRWKNRSVLSEQCGRPHRSDVRINTAAQRSHRSYRSVPDGTDNTAALIHRRYRCRCHCCHAMSKSLMPVAASAMSAVRFGCLCAAMALIGRPSVATAYDVLPAAAVRMVSRCAGAQDTVDCLLRAAGTGVDALAQSDEPVHLIPGCVTLVKNNEPAVGRETGPLPASAGDPLVDSISAFAESRAINVRAPVSVLDSLKHTLIEGNNYSLSMSTLI